MDAAEEIRLIADAKRGAPSSFEALVERYMRSAVNVAMGYTGNRDDALDLAQEAFYKVFKHLDRFREGERFAPWFFQILRNTCLSFLEKRRPARRAFSIHAADADHEDYPLPDGALGPGAQAEQSEAQRELWKAIERLSLKHREIILLRHFEDMDYAGIAVVLGIPIGTVMSRLFHARQKLRQELEPYLQLEGRS